MRLALVLALALALPAAALSSVRSAPAPCALVPAKTVSKDLGAPAKPLSERANNGTKVCVYVASTGQLQIESGSRAEFVIASPAASPPGTVIKREPSLGENGELSYNTRKRHRFADAAFELGAYYIAVYSNTASATDVLALAELAHKKLAG